MRDLLGRHINFDRHLDPPEEEWPEPRPDCPDCEGTGEVVATGEDCPCWEPTPEEEEEAQRLMWEPPEDDITW